MSKVKIGKIIFMKIKREIFLSTGYKDDYQRKYALQGPYQTKEVLKYCKITIHLFSQSKML